MLGVVLLLYPYDGTDKSKAFSQSLQFPIWVMLVGAQSSLWAVSAVAVFGWLRELKIHFVRNWKTLLLSSALFVLLVWMPYLLAARFLINSPIYLESPLQYHKAKIVILTAAGTTVALLAGMGLWVVHAALKDTFKDRASGREQISEFLRLRAYTQGFLSVAGAINGVATLSAWALHAAMHAYQAHQHQDEPPHLHVLLYGAYYSVVLALAYAPTHLALNAVGRQICVNVLPVPSERGSWTDWESNRKVLEQLLQPQLTGKVLLERGGAIWGPFIGSILSLLLGGQK